MKQNKCIHQTNLYTSLCTIKFLVCLMSKLFLPVLPLTTAISDTVISGGDHLFTIGKRLHNRDRL